MAFLNVTVMSNHDVVIIVTALILSQLFVRNMKSRLGGKVTKEGLVATGGFDDDETE